MKFPLTCHPVIKAGSSGALQGFSNSSPFPPGAMAATYVDSIENLHDALHYWKNYSFVNSYVNLDAAVNSLDGGSALVEARPSYVSRYVMCAANARGVQEVMFHTAAVYRWNSHMETGNFVLPGEQTESRVAESRIQTEISNLCQISIALDTEHDKTIWNAQKSFEAHIASTKGFNRTGKKRRTWQDGTSYSSSYIMSSAIFVRRSNAKSQDIAKFPYELHPSIKKALDANPAYIANPNRPRMFELHAGQLRDIKESHPPYIAKGDLVWISFAVEFVIGGAAWNTTFIPYEIVRVGTLSADLMAGGQQTEGTSNTAPQQGLQAGLRVSIADDFPMRAPASEGHRGIVRRITNSSLQPMNPGGDDERDYWSPSPPRLQEQETVGSTSQGQSVASKVNRPDLAAHVGGSTSE
ncbi:hypothetical protein OH77DRAFT_811174 [Trametes cingulata]|nr:hypothetical protein OH77DRAFT_811174 [Trametes cingulata]